MDRRRACARDRSDLLLRRSDRADGAGSAVGGGAGVAELIVLADGTEVSVRLESDAGRHSVTVEGAPSRVELKPLGPQAVELLEG